MPILSNAVRSIVTTKEAASMCVLRTEGATLRLVSHVFNRTIPTVWRHTFHIPHVNRHDKTIRINARNGVRVAIRSKVVSVADAKEAARMSKNRIKVRGVVKA